MNKIILFYRYSKLDKRHEYQLEHIIDVQNQWVWFYLGKYLHLRKKERLLPYHTDWARTRKLGTYRINSSQKRAECIIRAIKKNRKRLAPHT